MGKVLELKEANEAELVGVMLHSGSLANIDLHILSQLKGQILTLEEIAKIKEFLVEFTEDKDEIHSSGSEDPSESQEI